MDQNGGDSSTVKFIEIPFPAMPAALEARRIDAAFIAEPFLTVALKTGRVLAYGYDSIAKHFLFGAFFTTPQWAQDHPDVVSRFAVAIRETAAWANKNPVKSGEILAKYTKIDPAVIASMTRARFAEQLTPALMQPLIDVSAKYNGFASFPAQELLSATSRS
jgi:NitT/TauT family transport system substrate-binding protein